jgi:hypothetical protein
MHFVRAFYSVYVHVLLSISEHLCRSASAQRPLALPSAPSAQRPLAPSSPLALYARGRSGPAVTARCDSRARLLPLLTAGVHPPLHCGALPLHRGQAS